MSDFDSARAWLALKAYIASKSSHGKRDLLAKMGEVEVECMTPDEQRGFDPDPLPGSHRDRLSLVE